MFEKAFENPSTVVISTLLVLCMFVFLGSNLFAVWLQRKRIKKYEESVKDSDERIRNLINQMQGNRQDLIQKLNTIDHLMKQSPLPSNEKDSDPKPEDNDNDTNPTGKQ